MASGLEEIEPDSGLGKRTSSLSIHGHREDGEKNARESKIVIAAIDFGTTYSGYAYIFRDELDKANNSSEKRNVIYKHWQSGSDAGICSRKTPTCLLLNPKGEFDSFGYPAEGKYYNLTNDDAHHGWKFFKRFKMILLNEKVNMICKLCFIKCVQLVDLKTHILLIGKRSVFSVYKTIF